MEKISIKKAELSDLDKIIQIQNISNENILRSDSIEADISNNNCIYYLAYTNNTFIGYIGCSYIIDTMDILSILVIPEFRKLGVATLLLNSIIDFCKQNSITKILLEVKKSNFSAIQLYEKLQFIKISTRENYYKDEDALIYELNLN